MKRLISIPVMFAAAMASVGLGTGCASTTGTEQETYLGNRDPQGNFGGVMVAEVDPATLADKVIVVSFEVTDSGWTVQDTVVGFGSSGRPRGGADDFVAELLSSGGESLSSVQLWDPRKAIVEQQGIVMNERGSVAVRLPFDARAAAIRVRDKEGREVIVYELEDAMRKFCRSAPNDPDCARLASRDRR